MTFSSRRLILPIAVLLGLGLSACEQQTPNDSSSANPSDRTGQNSSSQPGSTGQPGQGTGSTGSDTQRSTNPSGDRP